MGIEGQSTSGQRARANGDATPVARHRRGDPARTLERLYRRHFATVYEICRGQLRSRQLAQDAAQEVFVRLARRPPSLHGGSPRAWIAKVARHVAIRIDRREKQRKARERQAARLHHEVVRAPGSSAGVFSYLRRLPNLSRQAVYLRVVQGRSLREVGLALGLSADAAQKRIIRALARLRELMEKDGRRRP